MEIKHIITIGVCDDGNIVYLPQKIETETLLSFYSGGKEVKAYKVNDRSQRLFAKFYESLGEKDK